MEKNIFNKSYGGYLPLELNNNGEYYTENNIVRLNSARSAIVLAAQLEKKTILFIPIYLCESVKKYLERYNISIVYYNISETFLPIISEEQVKQIYSGNALILLINYYGILPEKILSDIVRKYRNVIIDNTQAFFNSPIKDAYCVYSCRKFIGVSDGAYLVGGSIGCFLWKIKSQEKTCKIQ